MSENLNNLIDRLIEKRLQALLDGDAALVSATVQQNRDRTTVSDAVGAMLDEQAKTPGQRRSRRRRPRPAVGYHLNIDGRSVKAALSNLSHNPATVLAYVAKHAGKTNREITEALADELPAGKKAVESALDQLRTTDADGKRLDRTNSRQMRKALIVSKPLE